MTSRFRARSLGLSDSDEFDRQQRLLHCQRLSYQRAFKSGCVSLALGLAGLMAYTYKRGLPQVQTKAMLLAMLFTGGFWIGMEQTYLKCQMRMASEMAHERGLTSGDEDLYV